jgi:hypothetical protein
VIDNPSGVTLNRPQTFNGTITLTNGVLTTSGSDYVEVSTSGSFTGGSASSYVNGRVRRLFTTTPATLLYPLGSGGAYRPLSLNAQESTGTSFIEGRLISSDALAVGAATLPNKVSALRYYEFAPYSSTMTVNQISGLRVNSDDDVGAFASNTTLRIGTTIGTGGSWTFQNLTTPPNTTALPVSISTTSGLGLTPSDANRLYVALATTSNTDNPLPVELLAYAGESTSDGAELKWRTATETDNVGFTILKDGSEIASFSNTPSLRGRGTTSEETRYQFVDSKVKVGDAHRYSLRQTDLSGAVHDLGAVEVRITKAVAPREYSLAQNYPNPFNPTTVIRYSLKEAGDVKLEIFDVLGRKVATLLNARQESGDYAFNFNASAKGLSSGVYFYRLQAGGATFFSATKKMLLVK